jgi:hypothetical protein
MTFKEEHKEEFHEEQEGGAMWHIIVLSRLPPVPIVLLGLWMVVDGDGGCLSLTPWSLIGRRHIDLPKYSPSIASALHHLMR